MRHSPFWSGALLSLSLCLDLGLVNVAAMRAGMQSGASRSFALGLGSCVGDLVYAGAAMLGVTALLTVPAVRWVLWLGGGAVLLWLAFKAAHDAWRSARLAIDQSGDRAADIPLRSFFVQGVGLALASPSAILWFATAGGAVIAAQTSGATPASAAVTFFLGFFAAGVAWSAMVAVVSSRGRMFGPTFVRGFGIASAILFTWLAIGVLRNGYATFVAGR